MALLRSYGELLRPISTVIGVLACALNAFGQVGMLQPVESSLRMVTTRDVSPSLHRAAWHGDVGTLKACLEKGEGPDQRNDMGETPLHVAALRGNSDVVRLLVQYGAQLDTVDNSGATPVQKAARAGHDSIARFLWSRGADYGIFTAAMLGDVSRMQELLSDDAFLVAATDEWGYTPLHWASGMGHLEAVSVLTASGANLEARARYGNTPLFVASYEGQGDVVAALLEAGAEHSVVSAAAAADLAALSDAVARDASAIERDCAEAVRVAAELGHVDVLEFLLDRGCNPNGTISRDITGLHLAAGRGWAGAVKTLLSHGAEVNAGSGEIVTPLYFALRSPPGKRREIVKLLLEAGADPRATDHSGNSPVLEARKAGLTDVLTFMGIGSDGDRLRARN